MASELLDVIYRDDHIIAINKPPGLLVHRSALDKHETKFAVQMLRDQTGQHVYPAHRLDRPTSGVLVFAFNSEMAAALGHAMMQRDVKKHYLAMVRGWMKGSGVIDYALKYKLDKIADKHRRPERDAQDAVTDYSVMSRYELPYASGRYATSRYSLVALFPRTGRKHQIRRHLVHLRHPIIGDTTHGDGKQNKFLRTAFTFENLALSCTQMRFTHPFTQAPVSITAEPHSGFRQLLAEWGAYQL